MATVKTEKPIQPTEITIDDAPKTNDGTKNLFLWFRVLGIIMPKRFKPLYIIYSMCVHFLTFFITPMSFTLSYFFTSEQFNITHFLTSLQICFNIYGSAVKFCLIDLQRKQIFMIKGILDELDIRIKSTSEIQYARKAIRVANAIIIIFLISYYAFTTATFVGALFAGRPPYALYNPFINWRDSKWHCVAVSFIEYFILNAQIFQNICNDSYSLTYLIIIYCHLKMLIMRVHKIGTDPNCSKEENIKELVQGIKDHKNIIKLCDILIPMMSGTYFVIFTTITFSLGCSLINITIAKDNSTIFGSLMYILALFTQILPVCYFVNYLTDEFEHLSQAIYSNNWIEQSLEFRKLSLFFMHRTQVSIVFNAGKIFIISLDTFVSIVKFSFSLYTLLNKMDLGIN